MTNAQLHKVLSHAIQLFKDGHNNAYDPELQMVLCSIKAFVAVAAKELGQTVPFEEQLRLPYNSVDDQ